MSVLGVDERTVRRYVSHLLDLDVPVRSLRGRHGGYRLAPGYRMPPLMLTDDEALAAVLGLEQARRAPAPVPTAALDGVVAKIRRVLPAALGARLDALLATTEVTEDTAGPPPAAAHPAPAPTSAVLLVIAEAARDHRPVDVEYTGGDGRRRRRRVHPFGIVAHAGRWYVAAADPADPDGERDQGVRTFRLDRMRDPRVLEGAFAVPPGLDPTERVLSGLAEVPRVHDVVVRVQADAAEVRRHLPEGVATLTALPAGPGAPEGPGWLRVRVQAARLDWVTAVLASLDRPMVVERPEALREDLAGFARRLLARVEPVSDL